MKIFFVGDSPAVDTGFGIVSKNILKRLRSAGHEIAVLGINDYGDNPRKAAEYDFPIYPCDKGGFEQVYGFHKLWPLVESENPDILFLLNDPWLIKDYLDRRPSYISPYLKTVAYFPTDGGPLKQEWVKTLNGLDAQVCYSKFAESVIIASNNGERPANLHQVYHGVDTETFFPIDQGFARTELGIPLDTFIVGMVARNQPRKRFDILMAAFAAFAKGKENVKLYLHTSLRDVGFDIENLALQLKISDKLILSEGVTPNQGVPDAQLNLIYNSLDVHSLISLGDGFGLPVAESMATACPQIVSGHSCLKELVEDHGGLIVKNAAWIVNPGGINTWGGVSDVDDLISKLELMYNNREKRIRMAEDAYNFITQDKFKWDYAAERMEEILKSVYHIL